MFYKKYYLHSDRTDNLIIFLVGCLTGMVIGAVLGVLLAPHRGDITRRKLARRAGETKDQLIEAVGERVDSLKQLKGE